MKFTRKKQKKHKQSNKLLDFSASNVRKTTDSYYDTEFSQLKRDILTAAQDGNYKLGVKKELHESTISKLKNRGFTVTNHTPADVTRKIHGIYYTISWNY